jgi:hypothetical protein
MQTLIVSEHGLDGRDQTDRSTENNVQYFVEKIDDTKHGTDNASTSSCARFCTETCTSFFVERAYKAKCK